MLEHAFNTVNQIRRALINFSIILVVTSVHWLVVVSPVYYKNVVFGVVSFPLCKNMWKLEDMMK